MVAVISVDAYSLFGFLRPETDLGSSNQEASPSAGKNTGVVLVPCWHMEVDPCSYFWQCGYF